MLPSVGEGNLRVFYAYGFVFYFIFCLFFPNHSFWAFCNVGHKLLDLHLNDVTPLMLAFTQIFTPFYYDFVDIMILLFTSHNKKHELIYLSYSLFNKKNVKMLNVCNI